MIALKEVDLIVRYGNYLIMQNEKKKNSNERIRSH